MAFQKAERRRVALKLAIDGPSGGGKSYSALRLARGLVGPSGRIAMIDTENGSGSLYADLTDYDVMEIHAPFTVQKYLQGITDAVAGKYDVLIIDSLTHEWDGEGGLLDQKLQLDKRPNTNSFTNWASISKQHKEFVAQLLQSPIHIISTMRSKMEYEVKKDDKGKSSPTKLGLAPIQRDGMEYEFTVVFDVTADHTAAVSKDRTGLFAGLCSTLTEEHGKTLATWLAGGGEPLVQPAPVVEPAANGNGFHKPESRGDAAVNAAPLPPHKYAMSLWERLCEREGIDPKDRGACKEEFARILNRAPDSRDPLTDANWATIAERLEASLAVATQPAMELA